MAAYVIKYGSVPSPEVTKSTSLSDSWAELQD